jgi:hypothetical protein
MWHSHVQNMWHLLECRRCYALGRQQLKVTRRQQPANSLLSANRLLSEKKKKSGAGSILAPGLWWPCLGSLGVEPGHLLLGQQAAHPLGICSAVQGRLGIVVQSGQHPLQRPPVVQPICLLGGFCSQQLPPIRHPHDCSPRPETAFSKPGCYYRSAWCPPERLRGSAAESPPQVTSNASRMCAVTVAAIYQLHRTASYYASGMHGRPHPSAEWGQASETHRLSRLR